MPVWYTAVILSLVSVYFDPPPLLLIGYLSVVQLHSAPTLPLHRHPPSPIYTPPLVSVSGCFIPGCRAAVYSVSDAAPVRVPLLATLKCFLFAFYTCGSLSLTFGLLRALQLFSLSFLLLHICMGTHTHTLSLSLPSICMGTHTLFLPSVCMKTHTPLLILVTMTLNS